MEQISSDWLPLSLLAFSCIEAEGADKELEMLPAPSRPLIFQPKSSGLVRSEHKADFVSTLSGTSTQQPQNSFNRSSLNGK